MIDFDRKTNQLLAAARHGRVGVRQFETALPEIARQLRVDADSNCFRHWAQSLNVDKLERKQIVDPKLLSVIGRLSGVKVRQGRTCHAGLIHTYGYLLSQLKTQFGFKRERWTSGVIESGLGIGAGTFSPVPNQGTLLQNATFLLMNVAFWNSPGSGSGVLKSDFNSLSPKLQDFDFNRWTIKRIREIVQPNPRRPPIELLTDLAMFRRATQSSVALLVYSCREGKQQRLVTCFPVNKKTVDELLDEARTNSTPIRPRHNLFLDSLSPEGLPGKREVLNR
jgi:hypothetical protein